MHISNCTPEDLDTILFLYQAARDLQTEKGMVVWPVFEQELIEREISERRQWKLIIDGHIACNWAITFDDKQIWGERDRNDSIYVHRIATNPLFRGNKYIHDIVSWAKEYARDLSKEYIRLDTLGNNIRLIEHYSSAGFTFLGMVELQDTRGLPGHYQREKNCCLFEMKVIE